MHKVPRQWKGWSEPADKQEVGSHNAAEVGVGSFHIAPFRSEWCWQIGWSGVSTERGKVGSVLELVAALEMGLTAPTLDADSQSCWESWVAVIEWTRAAEE
jgi:hypothetical protein